MSIKTEVDTLKTNEEKLKNNPVANFAYTKGGSNTAYGTDEEFDANGVSTYSYDNEQNIPLASASVLETNQTIFDKGFRSQASSLTRMLTNHFFGRVSFNLNKTVDLFTNFLGKLSSSLGTANGIATLDENGRIPFSQLPESAIEIRGFWNASTNTPHLIDGMTSAEGATKGDFYIVEVAGWFKSSTGQSSPTAVEGYTQFFVNDRIMYDGSVWKRLGAGDVKSVNGVLPVNGDIQNVFTLTQAQYNQLTSAQKAGKFFIVTDAVAEDASIIHDESIATNTVWSSSKTNSMINEVHKLSSSGNANSCIPENGMIRSWHLASGALNVPVASGAQTIITATRNIVGDRLEQTAIVLIQDSASNHYTYKRAGVLSSGAWTFSSWEKITTETDLANYQIGDISKANAYTGDLNDLTFGIYRTLATCGHVPINVNGICECIYRGSSTRIQLYTTDTNIKYFRVDSSSGWKDWQKLTTETDLTNALSRYEKSLVFDNTQSSAIPKGYWNEISFTFGSSLAIPSKDANYISMKVCLQGNLGQAVFNVIYTTDLVDIVCVSKSTDSYKLYGTIKNGKLYLLPLTTWTGFMYITDIKSVRKIDVSGARYSNTLYENIDTYPSEFTNTIVSETIDKVLNNALVAQGISSVFTISENFNLSDIEIYANSTLLNIQRFIVTPKNAITTATNYLVGTLSSYRPKQVLRFTAYVNHKGVEGYIETNGNVIIYLESGASGNIIFDNLMYFY